MNNQARQGRINKILDLYAPSFGRIKNANMARYECLNEILQLDDDALLERLKAAHEWREHDDRMQAAMMQHTKLDFSQ